MCYINGEGYFQWTGNPVSLLNISFRTFFGCFLGQALCQAQDIQWWVKQTYRWPSCYLQCPGKEDRPDVKAAVDISGVNDHLRVKGQRGERRMERTESWPCAILERSPLWGFWFLDSQETLKFPFPQSSGGFWARGGLAFLQMQTWQAECPCPSRRGCGGSWGGSYLLLLWGEGWGSLPKWNPSWEALGCVVSKVMVPTLLTLSRHRTWPLRASLAL